MGIENWPKTSTELLLREMRNKPSLVASILWEKFFGGSSERRATLIDGQELEVFTPEGVGTYLVLAGDYEPEVTTALGYLHEGMSLWNIGAHVGLRMIQAQKRVGEQGTVVAFEPTKRTFGLLEKNRGSRANVVAYNLAVGATAGVATLRDYGVKFGAINTLSEQSRYVGVPWRRSEPKSVSYEVEMVSIDEMVASGVKAPDWLVIDAEGFEEKILTGAVRTLEKYKPIVVFEVGDLGGTDSLRLILHLKMQGYVIFEVNKFGYLVPHDIQESYPKNGNLVAVHPQASREVFQR